MVTSRVAARHSLRRRERLPDENFLCAEANLARAQRSLRELKFDAGPHSVTRMALNDELRRAARGGDLRLAKLAVRAFTLMGESGHLLALSRTTCPVAHSARQAYRALLAENAGKVVAPSHN